LSVVLPKNGKSRTAAHLPAWRAFNRLVGTMMPSGLGKAGALVDAHGPRENAEGRLAAEAAEADPKGQSPAP
jgi:hypothetical protein